MRVLASGLFATVAWGGCFSTLPSPGDSKCAGDSAEFRWVNAPVAREAVRLRRSVYDATLADPAFLAGTRVRGEQRFSFAARGRHLVEVLLANPEADRFSFRLAAGGSRLDERPLIAPGPGRMRPKRNLRQTSLLAMVDGPAELTVASEAPFYILYAVRWTPAAEVEASVARWRERLRYLHSTYLTEAQGATGRRR